MADVVHDQTLQVSSFLGMWCSVATHNRVTGISQDFLCQI